MDWFMQNREWLLSGIAIVVPLAIIGWFMSGRKNIQKQKGGVQSTNIQAGRDVNLSVNSEDKDE